MALEDLLKLEKNHQQKYTVDLFSQDSQTATLRYSVVIGKEFSFEKMVFKNSKLIASKYETPMKSERKSDNPQNEIEKPSDTA